MDKKRTKKLDKLVNALNKEINKEYPIVQSVNLESPDCQFGTLIITFRK